MKKLDIKSVIVGVIIGTLGFTTVFAAGGIKSATSGGIKSATYSSSKVYFYGNEILLENPLVTIVNDGSSDGLLYMPMRELLEHMQFKVEWNNEGGSVNLTMNGGNNYKNIEVPLDISENEEDTKALDIMQKTGNWGYVEPYLKYMSIDGIEKVVQIYNSKHINPSEHKKASDYIEASLNISENEVDTKALDIMQKTGNWGYIEPYLKYMSIDGIEKVVQLYNSKHINPSEHKKASDYIKD